MKNTFLKTGLCCVLVMTLVGCSGYNKLLKSQDNELKYRKALEYYQAGKYQRTIQLLTDITHVFNGTIKDDSVAYYLATAYYKTGDFESSGMLFDDFRQTFTNSKLLEDAEYMYAKGFYYSSPVPNRDQGATMQALIAIDEYTERYPESEKKEMMKGHVEELTQKLHDKSFLNAKSYYITGKYKAAAMTLRNALNKYPTTNHREEIMYLTAKSQYLLAYNSYESLMRDRYLDMMDSYYSFVSEWPESKYVKELDKMQQVAKNYIAKFKDDDNAEIPIPIPTQEQEQAPE